MMTKRILYILLIIFGCIISLKAQYDFDFQDYDSIKIYKYDGLINLIPKMPPPPPPPNASGSLKEKHRSALEAYRSNKFGVFIDTTWQIKYTTKVAMDREGKFNHSIKWESGIKLNEEQIRNLDMILSGKAKDFFTFLSDFNARLRGHPTIPLKPNVSAMCYSPRHTIFFYKEDEVKHNIDICFECGRVQLDGREWLKKVHFKLLYYTFKDIDMVD